MRSSFWARGENLFAHRQQIAHIVGSIFKLHRTQRTLAPVGETFSSVDPRVENAQAEIGVRERVSVAEQTGGDLQIQHAGRSRARALGAELDLLAGGDGDDFAAGRGEQLPHRPKLGQHDGIDDEDVFRGGELHQAEFRLVAALGDEFRVEADDGLGGELAQQTFELLR